VVERALAELLDDGCVQQSGTKLIVTNFVAAQEASASDARRAREYRERVKEKVDEPSMMSDSPLHEPARGLGRVPRIVTRVGGA
jgi:hypothetical protein